MFPFFVSVIQTHAQHLAFYLLGLPKDLCLSKYILDIIYWILSKVKPILKQFTVRCNNNEQIQPADDYPDEIFYQSLILVVFRFSISELIQRYV